MFVGKQEEWFRFSFYSLTAVVVAGKLVSFDAGALVGSDLVVALLAASGDSFCNE